MSPSSARSWTAILPVKPLGAAKTRIAQGADGMGGAYARAFFQDTLAAALACNRLSSVLIATHDEDIAALGAAHGCSIVDDVGSPGINSAAAHAAGRLAADHPIAVIVSDLPCLTSTALALALDSAIGSVAQGHACYLPDAAGSGTTMWTGLAGAADPHFGAESAQAHRSAGALDIIGLAPTPDALAPARRDVDTEADLRDALELGVGPATRALLHATRRDHRIVVTSLRRLPSGALEVADESGRRLVVAWQSVLGAGLLDVRPGQRLDIDARTLDVVGLPS